MTNAKNLGILILCIVTVCAGVFAYANLEQPTPTIQEQCRSGDLNACNEVIKQKKLEYLELEKQMQSIQSGADEARGVIKEQLSGTFQ